MHLGSTCTHACVITRCIHTHPYFLVSRDTEVAYSEHDKNPYQPYLDTCTFALGTMSDGDTTLTDGHRRRITAVLTPDGCYSSSPHKAPSSSDKRFQKKWKEHFRKNGNIYDDPRSGRPLVITDEAITQMEQWIKDTWVPGCEWLAKELHKEGLTDQVVDPKTIAKALRERSDHVSRAMVRRLSPLSDDVKRKRVAFAQIHKKDDWKKVLFVDGKNFVFKQCRVYPNQGVWVYDHMRPSQEVGEGHTKIVVYGGVSYMGKTQLAVCTGTTGHRHREGHEYGTWWGGKFIPARGMTEEEFIDLLGEFYQPFMSSKLGRGAKLLVDHARPHFADETKIAYGRLKVDVIDDLPAKSPDLNIIENVWGWMEQQLRWKHFRTFEEFTEAVAQVWDEVPDEMLQNMVNSMEGRLLKVIDNGGDRIITKRSKIDC